VRELKYWIIGYKIGLIKKDELMARCDLWITEHDWSDIVYELSTESFYVYGNLNEALEKSGFKFNPDHFERIQDRLLRILHDSLLKNFLSKERVIAILYNFIKFKKDSLNLSSNDIEEAWHQLISHYELTNEGFSGRIRNKTDLLDWLNDKKSHTVQHDFFGFVLG